MVVGREEEVEGGEIVVASGGDEILGGGGIKLEGGGGEGGCVIGKMFVFIVGKV